MCGIAGFVSTSEKKEPILKHMLDRIEHRGPDGEGMYINSKVALGHKRLAIIDLHTGGQPIYNEDKSVVVVLNGEIYNYQELKEELEKDGHTFVTKTDTEVLVHGYEKWGVDLPKHLRGMYAFALWDDKKEALYLVRDAWGIKPLYYYQGEDTFLFASEIKAFLDYPTFKKELNRKILLPYLCFNSTPTKETFFKGVYRLDPGEILIFKKGKIDIQSFFSLQFEEEKMSMEEAVTNIKKAMQNSVQYHMIADVEVGSFLSSGIDSSYLVALAHPDKTYTIGYKETRYDEAHYAKELTEKLGIHNTSKTITKEEYMEAIPRILYHMDEPLANPSAISLYFLAGMASQDVKVVLTGEGADELFGGYNSYLQAPSKIWYNKIPYGVRHVFAKMVSHFKEARGLNFIYRNGVRLEDIHIGIGRVFSDKEVGKIVRDKKQITTKEITAPIYEKYKSNSDLVKRQAIDYYFWLVHDFLHAVDRNTMAFGLEARTPFLDDEVYEVARRLPPYLKVNKKDTKVALRFSAKEVLPSNAYQRKKLGFPVPLREWLKEEEIYKQIDRAFASTISLELFDYKRIKKLLEEHKSGKKDNYKKIWTIYIFIVWYQVFFT